MKYLSQVILVCILLILPIAALSATFEVTVNDAGFQPSSQTINIGDTVRWVNKGSSLHSATSETNGIPNGNFDSGLLNPGVTFEQTFALPGKVLYFDMKNTAKTGGLTVKDNKVVIIPGSNSLLLTSQKFDLTIYAKLNSAMRKVSVLFDGIDITRLIGQFASFQVTKTYDASLLSVSVPPFALPSGVHILYVEITTNSGLVVSDRAVYTVIDVIPAPGPPPFGWPCIESLLPCN